MTLVYTVYTHVPTNTHISGIYTNVPTNTHILDIHTCPHKCSCLRHTCPCPHLSDTHKHLDTHTHVSTNTPVSDAFTHVPIDNNLSDTHTHIHTRSSTNLASGTTGMATGPGHTNYRSHHKTPMSLIKRLISTHQTATHPETDTPPKQAPAPWQQGPDRLQDNSTSPNPTKRPKTPQRRAARAQLHCR